MNVDVELGDDLARALLTLTCAEELEEAVVIAVEHFVRKERLERFRVLKGKVNILANDELEAAELERAERLWDDSVEDGK